MNKALLYTVLAIAIIVGGFYALNAYIYHTKQAPDDQMNGGVPDEIVDYRDAEYLIAGERIKLQGGVAETEVAPGSASKSVTRYFGNDLIVDLNSDGLDDVVFLLTQETGGSGTFYYAVAALNTEDGYIGSEAVLIGDRIAPQSLEQGTGNVIVVNYADRAPGEDFSKQPAVGKSLRLLFDTTRMQFGEVVPDFEGEAEPARMTLDMKPWVWVSTEFNDGRTLKPNKPDIFVLTFEKDGRFGVKTDCNSVGGVYTVKNGTIAFTDMMQTEMYCEDSQEGDFASLLQNAAQYHFTSKGELVLDLKFDSGTVTFK